MQAVIDTLKDIKTRLLDLAEIHAIDIAIEKLDGKSEINFVLKEPVEFQAYDEKYSDGPWINVTIPRWTAFKGMVLNSRRINENDIYGGNDSDPYSDF